ncbi:MAG TPA: triose-phosphate isomerase [Streptosporangiaceae bacterium]|nr:triose-phosphate isomerase [Streptosporangiaceae bacterium]
MHSNSAAPPAPGAFVMNRSRRSWIGTSWKMNKTRAEAAAYVAELCDWMRDSELDVSAVIFPPFTALPIASAQLASCRAPGDAPERTRGSLQLGAQNMHWQPRGAQTGEISAEMLLDCDVSVVEIGHYERRENCGETDRSVSMKAASAVAAGLEPVICIGDSPDDRRYGVAAETVSRQAKIALHGLEPEALGSVVLAYEPGWAIGAGGTQAEAADVEAMHRVIRDAVRASHGQEAAEQIRVVCGGSVDAANAPGYARETSIDGLFVGRAALTAAGFIEVIEQYCAALPAADSELVGAEGDTDDRH